MWKWFFTAMGPHWDNIAHPAVMDLRWPFLYLAASLATNNNEKKKKSGRRARHRVFWVRALTVCSEIWTGQQLRFSVPDWSPEVFGLAQLSVWSGCFWDTDWPALKPNASLASKTLFVFPPFQQYLLLTYMIFGALRSFISFLKAQRCIRPAAPYIRMWDLPFLGFLLKWNGRSIWPGSPLCCLFFWSQPQCKVYWHTSWQECNCDWLDSHRFKEVSWQ